MAPNSLNAGGNKGLLVLPLKRRSRSRVGFSESERSATKQKWRVGRFTNTLAVAWTADSLSLPWGRRFCNLHGGCFGELLASGTEEARLRNVQNMLYTLEADIGNPPQTLRLQLDSGSSDLIAFSDHYHIWNSPTWHPLLKALPGNHTIPWIAKATYAGGAASGPMGQDIVCLHTSSWPLGNGRLCVPKQTMMVATAANFQMHEAHGLLGMGLPSLSLARPTYLQNVQRQIEDLSYGLALGSENSQTGFDTSPSELAIGSEADVQAWASRQMPAAGQFAEVQVERLGFWWFLYGMAPDNGYWQVRARVTAGSAATAALTRSWFIETFWPKVFWLTVQTLLLLLVGWMIFSCLTSYSPCCTGFCGQSAAKRALLLYTLVVVLTSAAMFFQCGEWIWQSGSFSGEVLAVLDSGTSLLVLPEADFWHMAFALLGNQLLEKCGLVQGGVLVCTCDMKVQASSFHIEVGGLHFELGPGNGLFEQFLSESNADDSTGDCLVETGLALHTELRMWVLGDVFLRQAVVVHNVQRQSVTLYQRAPAKTPAVEDLSNVKIGSRDEIAFMVLVAVITGLGLFALKPPKVLTAWRQSPQEQWYHSLPGSPA